MSGLFARLTSRVLVLAVVVSSTFGPGAVSADDSLELLNAEQRAYVEKIQAALAAGGGVGIYIDECLEGGSFNAASAEGKLDTAKTLDVLAAVNGLLSGVADTLREAPPTSMRGLIETNMGVAEVLENAYASCRVMVAEEGANNALQWGRDALGDLFGVSVGDGGASLAAKVRFLSCVASENRKVKDALRVAQDALYARVDEIKKEEELERELLGDQGGAWCFIATAAYGTSSAAEIDVLRDFRDEVLMQTESGRDLVAFYYAASPPVAQFIARHEMLRTVVREAVIAPIVAVIAATDCLWSPARP